MRALSVSGVSCGALSVSGVSCGALSVRGGCRRDGPDAFSEEVWRPGRIVRAGTLGAFGAFRVIPRFL